MKLEEYRFKIAVLVGNCGAEHGDIGVLGVLHDVLLSAENVVNKRNEKIGTALEDRVSDDKSKASQPPAAA